MSGGEGEQAWAADLLRKILELLLGILSTNPQT